MSEKIKCLKNSDNKAYIIPTNEWLKPIKPLITESSDAQLILAEMLNKEKILIRITNNNNKRLSIINEKLSNLPNFPLIYCTIICKESLDILDANYIINNKPVKGFCNGKSTDGFITLELMKYYKNNMINELKDNISINELRYFLDQALSAQLMAFQKYGFLHNDIHIGNFIIIQKDNYIYNYDFDKRLEYKTIKGKINFKVYIIDFGNSELLDPNYRSKYIDDFLVQDPYFTSEKRLMPNIKYKSYNKEFTLPYNLYETIKLFLSLCNNNNEYLDKIKNIRIEDNQILDFFTYRYKKFTSCIFSTYNSFDYFMIRALSDSLRMIDEIYVVLFNEHFIINK